MSDDSPDPGSAPRSRGPWRAYFQASSSPVFVVGGSRRLRYANPAWEKLVERSLSQTRGMKVSPRKSTSALGQSLAPPAESWDGRVASVRRADPESERAWWDIVFVPLMKSERVLGVIGFIHASDRPHLEKSPALPLEITELRKRNADWFSFDLLEGVSVASKRLMDQARLAAQTVTPLWLIGESGAGKETAARVMHHNGPTRERGFFSIDCRGLPPNRLENLLLGKNPAANFGTIYLKGPEALPRDVQEKFATRLFSSQAGELRLISGSIASSFELVKSGKLIEEFHASLSVLEIRIPPLRERPEDFPKLIARLVERIGKSPAYDERFMETLIAHDWPGNIRELNEAILFAVDKAGESPPTREHLPRFIQEKGLVARMSGAKESPGWTLDGVLESTERRLIELALRKCDHVITDAAEFLGVLRTRLSRRIEALKISTPATEKRRKSATEEG